MRNYVILNGVNSNTKLGLAIRELPPITKPLMRTIREEIDGKKYALFTTNHFSVYAIDEVGEAVPNTSDNVIRSIYVRSSNKKRNNYGKLFKSNK